MPSCWPGKIPVEVLDHRRSFSTKQYSPETWTRRGWLRHYQHQYQVFAVFLQCFLHCLDRWGLYLDRHQYNFELWKRQLISFNLVYHLKYNVSRENKLFTCIYLSTRDRFVLLNFAPFLQESHLFNSGIVSWLGVFPLNEAPWISSSERVILGEFPTAMSDVSYMFL